MEPRDPRQKDAHERRPREPIDRRATPVKAVVVLPEPARRDDTASAGADRSAEVQLAEAVNLAEAIGLVIAEAVIVPLRKAVPATLIGPGKVEELAALIRASDSELVIVDHPLTPVQQRNLEKAWSAKVLDRTALILEIFGERAQTREGRLQVELAHLNYQRSRLVRSWTHLERQRGGHGFLGGPGETQIEADRRQIQTRIRQIEKQLEGVRNMRSVHRSQRKSVPRPIVALVGYTNAGKSSLFNRLTGAEILAKDMVFATLDPTLRRVALPHGEEVIVSDTVGFISALPTSLVAAFRATLEEVQEADLILHVRDIASPDSAQQAEDVMKVLGELGIHPGEERAIIEVWNKIDLLEPEKQEALRSRAASQEPPAILVSAARGAGVDALLARIEQALMGARPIVSLTLAAEKLGALGWLYENTEVLERTDDSTTGDVTLRVRLPEKRVESFQAWAEREGVPLTASH